MKKEQTLYSDRPRIEGKYISIDPLWWKMISSYQLSATEQLAAIWYWMEGENDELSELKHVFVKGSRTTEWRIKEKLKQKNAFPLEMKKVYVDRKGI